MPRGGCRGGIPGLGPCKTWPGRVITGAVGEPSWLSLPASESVSLLESLMSSGGLTPPAGANFEGSNSGGMNGPPAGGMAVGDSIMGPGKAGGLLMGAAC